MDIMSLHLDYFSVDLVTGLLIEQDELLNTQNSTLNKLSCREVANRQCFSAGCIMQPVVQIMVPQHFKLFCKNYVRHKKNLLEFGS